MICKKCKREIPNVSTFCLFCGASQLPKEKKKQRRMNGMGSVSKHSTAVTRPWRAIAPEDRDGNRPLIGYFATKQEANDALLEYKRAGINNAKINITFKALYDEWAAISFKNISKQTQDNYKAAYKKCDKLYSLKFREIRTVDMQRIFDYYGFDRPSRDKDGRTVILPPMSHSSLTKIKALLTQLYDYAVQNDIVTKNYAAFITLPRAEKTSKDCFSDIELKKIEQAAYDGIPFADCILMMCYTGFRISEFLELTPFDYNPDNDTLTGGKKTNAGKNRVVPVHAKIKPYLLKWIVRKGQTIICKDDGSSYAAGYFRTKCYYPALECIGIRKLSPHATRHTMATRMAASGARPEDIQRILGHEDYEVTANTYIHQDLKSLENAIRKLG